FVWPKPVPEGKVEGALLQAALLERGEELAAQLLDSHGRERKPVWWPFFDRLQMPPDELVEDSESIGRLELAGEPEQVTKQSKAYTLTFPRQEHKLGTGSGFFDPAT